MLLTYSLHYLQEKFYNSKSDFFRKVGFLNFDLCNRSEYSVYLIKGRFNIYPRFQEYIKNKTVFIFAEFPVGISHLT